MRGRYLVTPRPPTRSEPVVLGLSHVASVGAEFREPGPFLGEQALADEQLGKGVLHSVGYRFDVTPPSEGEGADEVRVAGAKEHLGALVP